jgi:hypothetical protein
MCTQHSNGITASSINEVKQIGQSTYSTSTYFFFVYAASSSYNFLIRAIVAAS